MTIKQARELAAQAWCHKTTSHLPMQPEVAEVFAQMLVKATSGLENNETLEDETLP